jgi:hypothetical protein
LNANQWEWARPVPHMPQDPGDPVQAGDGGSLPPPLAEANTENFFVNRVEPQCGHFVPFQSAERIKTSLSLSHFPQ